MLAAARRQQQQVSRLAQQAVVAAQRAARQSGDTGVASTVITYQAASARLAGTVAVPAMLAEQGIPDNPLGSLNLLGFTTAANSLTAMLSTIDTDHTFARLVESLVQDTARAAEGVATAIRPEVTGYVRYLNLPSCSRCVVLAGRVYRFSTGFLRHPNDDCGMMPTTEAAGRDLITDPMEAFRRGQITDLSKADAQAIREGADLGQVVNVRRKRAGLTTAGEVLGRAGRPTPAGIYRMASDRTQAIDLLRRHGYIR